jgi:phosphate transport system substrate-binding protein
MRRLGLTLLLAGCAGEEADPKGPLIRVAGSDTMTRRLLPALAEGFQKTHADVRFEIAETDSGEGVRALLDGDADLAASSRGASPAEREQAKVNGYALEEHRTIVAVNVISVAVNPQNLVESLTYDQLIGIFCTGEIDDWSFIGLDPLPIRAIARDGQSGTRAAFEDFFCGPKGLARRVEILPVGDIPNQVSKDPRAISFMSLSEQPPKVVGLRAEALAHPVLPSQQNVIRGSYPLYHDLYLFSNGAPAATTSAFIDWIKTPAGQDIVDEERFVPLFLRPARMDEPRPLRETIHFEVGSSTPDQRSLARIQLLVEELKDRSQSYGHIVLEGFVDDKEADPIALSQKRAEAVKGMLETAIPGTFFEIIPRGPANPIAPNATPFGRQQNRRVQIYLSDEEKPDEAPSSTASPKSPPTEPG